MSKIFVAHGGNIGFHGGGTKRVLAFAKALAENGHEVSLVVPKPVGGASEDLGDIKIYTVPVKPRGVWDQIARAVLVSLKAKRIANKENAILQIEHSTLGGITSLLGCSDYVLDVIDLEFDGDLYKKVPMGPRLIRHLEQKAVSKAKKVVVVSEPMKDFLVEEWKIPDENVILIPNGFDERISKFRTNEEEKGLISFIGVFTHNIDYEKVIRLARSREDVKIYVIGDGPMRKEFIKMVQANNLDNVLVPGFLPDEEAYEILARSQVCFFPLRNTLHTKVAGHMKAFDYAALGKAIATDRDGTAIIFEKHNAALVSDPANPDEFIENVYKLLSDEKLREKLGENARKLVKDFTWERQGKKLVKMYENG